MNTNQYRKKWLRQHAQYEKLAYKELILGFKDLGNSIPFELMTLDNYELILSTSANTEQFINIYFNIYDKVGKIHGERIGKSINKQLKNFTSNTFLSLFDSEILNWLFNNAITRIVTVRATYLEYLKQIILTEVEKGNTISQIATNITKLINQRGFYRWQALRIARTETTAAANYAAMQAGRSSGVLMDKVWISAVDSRTRQAPKSEYDHIRMNEVKVSQGEPFLVPFKGGFEKLQFAGDPQGNAGNVINCRCTNALVPRRDSQGRIIRV